MSKSSKDKGAEWVREFRNDVLEPSGFLHWKPGNKAVWYKGPDGKMRAFSQSQDIFEIADINALRADLPVLYIQCTSAEESTHGGHIYERRKKFENKATYFGASALAIVAGRIPGKKVWKLHFMNNKPGQVDWIVVEKDIKVMRDDFGKVVQEVLDEMGKRDWI